MKIRMFRNLKCPDRRIRTICDLFRITVFHPLHGQFHIRLPGTDPHVPDQNVLYDRLVSGIIPNIHRIRTARLRFLHPYFPYPFPIGKGNIFLSQKSNHYLSPRLVKSPDTHPLFLLQHHTVTDQSWKLPFAHIFLHSEAFYRSFPKEYSDSALRSIEFMTLLLKFQLNLFIKL